MDKFVLTKSSEPQRLEEKQSGIQPFRTWLKCRSKWVLDSRWNLAFVQESLEQVLEGHPISFISVTNPYQDKCWFADPFILDISDDYIYLLVEEMRFKPHKGRIAKLTIDRRIMTIIKMDIVLEEPWHLSFPNIMRKNKKVYVYPESAYGGKLHLYELVQDKAGKDVLKMVKTICDDVVWDSEISSYFGNPLLFTSRSNDYYLDIYKWNDENERFQYLQSLNSQKRNMRMAGSIFKVKDRIYCPSQISGYTYGQSVEIKEIRQTDNGWEMNTIRKLMPPKGILIDGLW